MRILFIGGTKMTGPFAVRDLIVAGHQLWLLHRSPSDSPLLRGATQIQGDKSDLPRLRDQLAPLNCDIVVHMCAFSAADAITFIQTFSGIVPRALIISSIDVYRAYGRLHRTEPGDPDPTPLTEDAPLRSKLSIHGQGYDKTAVERICQSDPRLPCTILRYPAVYGPGDSLHRLHAWVRRMDDGRPFILFPQSQANWRFSHGYVENVARALVLAITNPAAMGQIYNVAESQTLPWPQWAEHIGRAINWPGRILLIPDNQLPAHLADDLDFRQSWTVDTARIRRELGYAEMIAADECLRRAIAWERSHQIPLDPKAFDYPAEGEVAGRITATLPIK